MKKFKFRLESVLKVRNLHKKQAERDVALTQSQLNRTDADLKNNQEAWRESFANMPRETENLAFWHQVNQQWQGRLQQRKKDLEEQKGKLEDRLSVEKMKLTRRVRDEMVMDKLKEYQKQEYLREADSVEQQEIEEIDLLKRGHK